ncbi:hypothetical protein ACTJJ0_06170 [Chitinophaga sp. 22321]|uniref:IPT/TIG domain-containing protein n=1 Tax=Chitinophaga hostae TaxID=2831022 RepID=A0ABS5IZ37_9BACT|nr:hypothetical protein [Chitinophaga hostae]MBS0028155.1 hypothetical protein [Chitinophaga hostae]
MKTSIRTVISITCLLWLTQCKKVDKNERLLNSQPSIITSHATLIGTKQYLSPDDQYSYQYKTSFKPGDTMELAGRLFPQQLEIKIGGVNAKVVMQQKITILGTPEIPAVEADFLKLVITKAMGTGRSIPVELTANGETITAPPINILEPSAPPPYLGGGKTDTTLVVASLFSFKQDGFGPADRDFVGGNVTAAGNIFFFNKKVAYLTSITGKAPAKVLEAGLQYSSSTDQFQIIGILSATCSWDGADLFISAEVTDNGPNNPLLGTDPNAKPFGVLRLLKMNLGTKKITPLNRSLFGGRGTNRVMYGWPPQKSVAGNIDTVSIIAQEIRVDAYGNLYVTNQVERRSVTIVSKISPDGQVKTLFSLNRNYPGLYPAAASGYVFHPSTLQGFAGPADYATNTTLLRPAWYSFRTEEPLLIFEGDHMAISCNYSDTSRLTGKYPTQRTVSETMSFIGSLNTSSALLSTGEIVSFSYASPMSYNMEKKVAYIYAGQEINELIGSNAPLSGKSQVNTTGLAKYVNFSSLRGVLGVDNKDAIYLFTEGRKTAPPDSPESYLQVYKLRKP